MKPVLHRVCLLLGSNIQPEKNLPLAMGLLQERLRLLKASSVWESRAIGSDGPNMLNAAILALTTLQVGELKEQLIRPIEAQLGRVRTADKNAPRPIDIDPILFDQDLLEPGLWRLAYRAVPVAEVLPGYRSGVGESLQEAAARLAQVEPIWLRPDVSLDLFPAVSGVNPAGE